MKGILLTALLLLPFNVNAGECGHHDKDDTCGVIIVIVDFEKECKALQYRPARNPELQEQPNVPPKFFDAMRLSDEACLEYTRPLMKDSKKAKIHNLAKQRKYTIRNGRIVTIEIPFPRINIDAIDTIAPIQPLDTIDPIKPVNPLHTLPTVVTLPTIVPVGVLGTVGTIAPIASVRGVPPLSTLGPLDPVDPIRALGPVMPVNALNALGPVNGPLVDFLPNIMPVRPLMTIGAVDTIDTIDISSYFN